MKHEFPVSLVEKELNGAATPNDVGVLESNLNLWKDHLISLKVDLEQQIIERKAASIAKGIGNQKAYSEFLTWKKGANYFKIVVERKLSDVKDKLGHSNQNKNGQPLAPILEDILSEIRFIADVLRENIDKDAE